MDNRIIEFLSRPANVSSLIAASVLLLLAFILLLFWLAVPSAGKRTKRTDGTEEIYSGILRENEISANLFFAKVLLSAAGIVLLISVFAEKGMIPVADKGIAGLVFACLISATATAALLTIREGGRAKYAKIMLVCASVICNFLLLILLDDSFVFLLIVPLIISVRYADAAFSGRIAAVCAFAGLLVRPASFAFRLFAMTNGMNGSQTGILSPQNTAELFANGQAGLKTVFVNELPDAVASTVLIVFVGVCASAIALQGRKMISESAVLTEKKNAAERETEEANAKIMMSQLQPHFLYNSLSAIMAIDGNPPETMDALADFARYLRANLDSLTCSDLIPFAAENEHIEHYFALEKLRFGQRLELVRDFGVTDFMIPPLCVQMAVENAVKHGISQKPEGGTVTLSTREQEGEVIITVADDGVGFDPNGGHADGGSHVGMNSGAQRVKRLTGGRTEIVSAVGEGTKVIIHIPREKSL